MSLATQKLLIQLLKKIPLFDGLYPNQVRKLLSICHPKSLVEGDELCHSDTPSDEIYILLKGQLSVVTAEGLRVAAILPVTTVGEMGVITGQPRSATVEAVEESQVLSLKKAHFDALLGREMDIAGHVYRNVIHILATKLVDDNIHLRDQQIEKNQFASRIRGLELQIDLLKRRCQLLVNYLGEQEISTPEQTNEHVEAKMLELDG